MRLQVLCSALGLTLAANAASAASMDMKCPKVAKFAPGIISTDDNWEWRLTFTPTRKQAYWATSAGWWPGTREQSYIKTSTFLPGSGWSLPVVAPFSGIYADFDPFVSPGGATLYFSSMRPANGVEKADMDLWMVRRNASGWGEPLYLGDEVNTDGYDELYPSIDLEGNLYFARVKAPIPTEDVDIWVSRRRSDGTFGAPERLGPGVNTPDHWEYNPEVSPDGRTLLFARLDLPDDGVEDSGYGFGDLYVSRMRGRTFATGQNLGPCVNTEFDEFHPTVLWDRGELYFAKDIGIPSDFYQTKLRLPRP